MKFLIVSDFRGSKYPKKLVEDFKAAIRQVVMLDQGGKQRKDDSGH